MGRAVREHDAPEELYCLHWSYLPRHRSSYPVAAALESVWGEENATESGLIEERCLAWY